jgi:signal transduction histidine kinase
MNQLSLTKRVVILSSLWTTLAIVLLGWLLLSQFRSGADHNFGELQQAQLYSLIGAVTVDDKGNNISGVPNLGNSSFLRPGSGWFWRVELLDAGPAGIISSPSIADRDFERPSLEEIPYGPDFSRTFISAEENGDDMRVLEAEIDLGNELIALFQVGGNNAEFEAEIRNFAVRTITLLGVFGIGAVAINMMIILYGLSPLDRIRRALSDIRDGKSETLEGDFPSELTPMVDEMNTLVDNNRRIVERARTQVGNLAHSLKTPIAVLMNEGEAGKPVAPNIVKAQAKNMQTQVQHYLSRARIAAQRGSVTYRTNVRESMDRICSVMQKLNPDKSIELNQSGATPLFAGEREDFEEIVGNLLENACKWGRSRIRVSAGIQAASAKNSKIEIVVEDDGPGISEENFDIALKRGQRLDESVPGTGLGLSIVADMIDAYGGAIILSKSELGGLKVCVSLPSTT